MFAHLTKKETLFWVGICLLVGSWFAIKLAFLAKGGGIPNEIFNDDGGVYVSTITIADNPELIQSQSWFRVIQNGIGQKGFVDQWGQGSARIGLLFEKTTYMGFTRGVGLLKFFFGNYKEAFRYSIGLVALLLLFKYLFLGWIFFPSKNYAPVLFSATFLGIFEVLSHNFFSPTSSAYAWIFMTTAVTIWAFKEILNKTFIFITLGLLVVAGSMSPIAMSVVAVLLGLIAIKLIFPKLVSKSTVWIIKNYKVLVFLPLVLIPIVSLLQIPIVKHFSPQTAELLKPFRDVGLNYLHPIILLLVVGVSYLLPKYTNDKRAVELGLISLVLCWAAFGTILVAPLASPLFQENKQRLMEYIYLFLVTTSGRILIRNQNLSVLANGLIIMMSLFTYSQMLPFSYWFPKKESIVLESVPPVKKMPSGKPYYLAKRNEQVLSYFENELYKEAPLVIDIRTAKYSPDLAIELIEKN